MGVDEFAKKTINLDDGFDALLPATHPHVGKPHPQNPGIPTLVPEVGTNNLKTKLPNQQPTEYVGIWGPTRRNCSMAGFASSSKSLTINFSTNASIWESRTSRN